MPIPANRLVSVNPAVLGAGGGPLEFNGMILTDSALITVGPPTSFVGAASVGEFFGGDQVDPPLVLTVDTDII